MEDNNAVYPKPEDEGVYLRPEEKVEYKVISGEMTSEEVELFQGVNL